MIEKFTKTVVIDSNGFYLYDYVYGDGPLPELWTQDIPENGMYKAKYSGGIVDDNTGEVSGGSWSDTASPTLQQKNQMGAVTRDVYLQQAYAELSPFNMKVNLGRTLSEEEKKRSNAILDYIDALNAVSFDDYPAIKWPEKP